jgi:hypothetical protein
MCSNSCSHTSRNLLPGKLSPRTSLICVVAIMIAAADVKPTDTGPEIKSIKKPEKTEQIYYILICVKLLFKFRYYKRPLVTDLSIYSVSLIRTQECENRSTY